MKLCMIGCGSHSTNVHGPSFQKYANLNKNTELVACCDLNMETAAKYAGLFGFARFYSNYMEMLNTERPDMVCIILPVNHTEEVAVAVLKAGYHCIIEKPPALKPEGVSIIQSAQECSQKQLRVCFNRRYMPLVRNVYNKVTASGEAIQAIHYEMHRYRRGNEEFSGTAIHGVDLVKHIAGSDYEKLSFDYVPIENNGQTGSHIYLTGYSEKGTMMRLAFLPLAAADRECISVHTSSTGFFIELPVTKYDRDGSLRIIRNGIEESVPDELAARDGTDLYERNGFYYCISSFLDVIRAGGENTEGVISSTLQSVEIAQCIKEQRESYSRNS